MQEMSEPTAEHEELTVLIVDDEQGLADLYTLYLDDGYQTRTAYDGDEALEAVDDGVDVILLDRRMPTLSGGEVLAELRDRGYEQPVSMLTAVDPGEDIHKMDIDDYFVKPISEEELTDAVDALAARTRYDDEFREYFAAISKKAAMEANMNEQNLASSDAYQKVKKEAEAAEHQADIALEECLATDTFADFREF